LGRTLLIAAEIRLLLDLRDMSDHLLAKLGVLQVDWQLMISGVLRHILLLNGMVLLRRVLLRRVLLWPVGRRWWSSVITRLRLSLRQSLGKYSESHESGASEKDVS